MALPFEIERTGGLKLHRVLRESILLAVSETPDDAATIQLIDERDKAQEALSQAYYLITGRSPEWSNTFGYAEALEDIDDAQKILRQAQPAPDEGACAKVLREVEFVDTNCTEYQCPLCYGSKSVGHDKNCQLAAALASAPALQGTVAGFDEWWSSHSEHDLEIKHAGSSGKSIARRAWAASHPQAPGDELAQAANYAYGSYMDTLRTASSRVTDDQRAVVLGAAMEMLREAVDAALSRRAAPAEVKVEEPYDKFKGMPEYLAAQAVSNSAARHAPSPTPEAVLREELEEAIWLVTCLADEREGGPNSSISPVSFLREHVTRWASALAAPSSAGATRKWELTGNGFITECEQRQYSTWHLYLWQADGDSAEATTPPTGGTKP